MWEVSYALSFERGVIINGGNRIGRGYVPLRGSVAAKTEFSFQRRINPQVSHLAPSFPPPFPLPFEWSIVNGTTDHPAPTPGGSAGGPSTVVALQRTKNRPRLPSSPLKKASNSSLMPLVPFLLPSPAFPPPRRPPNKRPMFLVLAPTPCQNARPPPPPDPRLPSFPDGLLQTY